MSVGSDIAQLQAQQSLLTDSLRRMLTAEWVGFPSLEADVLALSPGIVLDPHPPMLESQRPEPPTGWQAVYDPHAHCTVSVGIFLVNCRLQIGQGFVITYVITLHLL